MSFVRIITPSDIQNEQQILKAAANQTNRSVLQCASLDSGTAASWNDFYTTVQAFCAEIPVWFFPTGPNDVVMSSNMFELAKTYERNILSWQQKLSKTCAMTGPQFDPNQTQASDPMQSVTTALKYGAIIAGFLGSAYMVGKIAEVVELVPRSKARS